VRDGERVVKTRDCPFKKCDCALESAFFEPKSRKIFKIPASCHPRPPNHVFAPRDTDVSNPSIRMVVDNINAFPRDSMEPNLPYANKDIEDLFYPVGTKDVHCFDGGVVGGVVRYNMSYAVVDFRTIDDAEAALKMFQGRKAYSNGYHLRLKYVNVKDRTFGRRMAASMGPWRRARRRGEHSQRLLMTWTWLVSIWLKSLYLFDRGLLSLLVLLPLPSRRTFFFACISTSGLYYNAHLAYDTPCSTIIIRSTLYPLVPLLIPIPSILCLFTIDPKASANTTEGKAFMLSARTLIIRRTRKD
jgi:hypothetical protein